MCNFYFNEILKMIFFTKKNNVIQNKIEALIWHWDERTKTVSRVRVFCTCIRLYVWSNQYVNMIPILLTTPGCPQLHHRTIHLLHYTKRFFWSRVPPFWKKRIMCHMWWKSPNVSLLVNRYKEWIKITVEANKYLYNAETYLDELMYFVLVFYVFIFDKFCFYSSQIKVFISVLQRRSMFPKSSVQNNGWLPTTHPHFFWKSPILQWITDKYLKSIGVTKEILLVEEVQKILNRIWSQKVFPWQNK